MNLTVQIISIASFFNPNSTQDHQIIERSDNGVEGLKFTEEHQPIIVFLDYEIQQENTSIFIKTLLTESPSSKVILLGHNLSDKIVLSSLVNGCSGYIDWKDTEKFLDKAIQFVGSGGAWISRRLVGLLLEKIRG